MTEPFAHDLGRLRQRAPEHPAEAPSTTSRQGAYGAHRMSFPAGVLHHTSSAVVNGSAESTDGAAEGAVIGIRDRNRCSYKEALMQIRRSLLPYDNALQLSPLTFAPQYNANRGGKTNNGQCMGDGRKEGKSGAQQHPVTMLDALVNMGFDKETAWQALKATHFESLYHVVDYMIKQKTREAAVERSQNVQTVLAGRTCDRPCYHSGSNIQYCSSTSGISCASDHSYSGASEFPARGAGGGTTGHLGYCNSKFSAAGVPSQSLTGRDVGSRRTDWLAGAESVLFTPRCHGYAAPVKQFAGVERNSAATVTPDAGYIESLCQRANDLLSLSKVPAAAVAPNRMQECESDAVVNSAPKEGVARLPVLYNVQQAQHSPGSSSSSTVEGASSGTSSFVAENGKQQQQVVRCESPLPEGIEKKVLNRRGRTGLSSVKPCTAKAFRFFMEQHVENVVKMYNERVSRRLQIEREMSKAVFSAQLQCHMRRLLAHKESSYLRLKRQKLEPSMFQKLKTIGVGAFGEVALVVKKDTNSLFAMKVLRKCEVIKRNQAAHVKAERDILAEADNEWVVKLYYSFQDKDSLYFIMEYIPGGDLMALLIKKGIFDEPMARFYVAELVCAVESVHRLGFIHRDIKPDNILIDRDGHIKLTDFGLCTGLRWTHDRKYYDDKRSDLDDGSTLTVRPKQDKWHKVLIIRHQKQQKRRKALSLVGTPNYIAPEVLMRVGYTQLCDWWSVGVILYEMVVGQPPFLADTPEETQSKVINWQNCLSIPVEADLSADAVDIILRLCCSPEQRLGKDVEEIKKHPFFYGIDWENLRQTPPPYRPEILHDADTSNFDPVEETNDAALSLSNGSTEANEHAFYEFTFRRFFDANGRYCPTLGTYWAGAHPFT